MQGAQAAINEQDAKLDLLRHTVQNLGYIGLQIGTELDKQNSELSDLNLRVDANTIRVRHGSQRIDRIREVASSHGRSLCIILLIVIIVIMVILRWGI